MGLFRREPKPLTASVQTIDQGTNAALLSLAGVPTDTATITRDQALKVPALSNGVALFTSITQTLPLVAETPTGNPSTSEAFLAELDPNFPVGWTKARTVDDLIFYGEAWWRVLTRDYNGFPRTVEYVAVWRVTVEHLPYGQVGNVYIDGETVDPNDVIRFLGVKQGLLASGAEAISTALANVQQVRTYARNPSPSMYLVDADGAEPLEPDDAVDYLQALTDASTKRGSAYLAGLRLETVGWNARELQLVEARQLDAVEMARLLAIHPRYVAAPSSGSDLTYANLSDVRRDLIEVGGLAQYLPCIEQRLSMPDVTPRGTTVKFSPKSFWVQISPDAVEVDPQTQEPL